MRSLQLLLPLRLHPQTLRASAISRIPTTYRTSTPPAVLPRRYMGSTSSTMPSTNFPISKPDSVWRAKLTPQQFRILREAGTEAPHTGEYDKHYPSKGVYACAGCDKPLYTAEQKFKSGCGWPAFFDAIPGALVRKEDVTFGMRRIEILCAGCGGHLGHVFKGEGFATPTDERHCVNSVSLRFKEDEGK